MKVQRPKGTVDILPAESGSWEKVETNREKFLQTCQLSGNSDTKFLKIIEVFFFGHLREKFRMLHKKGKWIGTFTDKTGGRSHWHASPPEKEHGLRGESISHFGLTIRTIIRRARSGNKAARLKGLRLRMAEIPLFEYPRRLISGVCRSIV